MPLNQLDSQLGLGSSPAPPPSPNMPVTGILRISTSSRATDTQGDRNHSKFRKRPRWDEDNILATSCHSWLLPVSGSMKVKPWAHLCSITMQDEGASTSTSGEHATCFCMTKRKKTQSWDENSIIATQPPYPVDPWTKTDDGFTASIAWQYLSLRDDTGPGHSSTSTSYSQPPCSQLKLGNNLSASYQIANEYKLDPSMDNSQHGLMGIPEQAIGTNAIAAEKSADVDYFVMPSFEALRKAHFREGREVLLAYKSTMKDDDEDMNNMSPKLNYYSCIYSGRGNAAPVSRQTETSSLKMEEKKAYPSDMRYEM
ncbi:uncharacterized protein LOC105029567 isoform X2 [Esox lucius]|nr:uncharacterized protein LOC105029567 isoform X2 [Esox lucius]XP_019904212.1 uncharacterized protein LOC105029567 isoform X2 [Esox lucius]